MLGEQLRIAHQFSEQLSAEKALYLQQIRQLAEEKGGKKIDLRRQLGKLGLDVDDIELLLLFLEDGLTLTQVAAEYEDAIRGRVSVARTTARIIKIFAKMSVK